MERDQAVMRVAAGVGMVGLSGYQEDAEVLTRACAYFVACGWPVRLAPPVEAAELRFAGSARARLAALEELLEDPSLGLILALRGGYGITQLLPQINFARIAERIGERSLLFCGHSDFTAFGLALFALTGQGSLAGPNAVGFGDPEMDDFTRERFWQAIEDRLLPLTFATSAQPLAVTGTLWGGNLSMLVSLLGTPYFPRVKGGILFLEDVNEHPYRVERMLLQLHYAGVLADQAAVLIGDITHFRLTPYDRGYDLSAALAMLASHTKVPVVTGLPFGHLPRKATLPLGRAAWLEVDEGLACLSFAAPASAALGSVS